MNPNVSSTFISYIIQNCSLPKLYMHILIKYTYCVIETEILVSPQICFSDAISIFN